MNQGPLLYHWVQGSGDMEDERYNQSIEVNSVYAWFNSCLITLIILYLCNVIYCTIKYSLYAIVII